MKAEMNLEGRIRQNLKNRVASDSADSFDIRAETEAVLNDVGASLAEFGGDISFYGQDPIIPSVLRYGAFSAIGLAAKAAQVASIWKMKTGQSQDIRVDVRKALRRFATFYEGYLETVNGFPGKTDSEGDSGVRRNYYKCKDGRWIYLTCNYPALRTKALQLLQSAPGEKFVAEAIATWDSFTLEQAAEEAGVPMHVLRSPEEFLSLDLFQETIKNMPLISVEKLADSDPMPFQSHGDVLGGIRALGLGHVIAGAGVGRALALHGADVLNIWRPNDYEHSVFHYTSNVGMRSAMLDMTVKPGDRAKFDDLLAGSDVFFSNRRNGFLQRHGLTAEELCKNHPGLICASIYFNGEQGVWSNRVGFDVSTGAFAGPYWLESENGSRGPIDQPRMTPQIGIISDYVAAWLGTVGILQALKRRAVEGGSYKVSVSLTRTVSWLMSLGIFDQEYARSTANSNDEHAYIDPDPILAETPMGLYRGVAEQVEMTRTPGHYKHLLLPLRSSKPEWEEV
ncbi:CoA transferase [Dyella humicola]|uniref:CoA transferase n=1 Tax=Dyella humicola TaxID=2992126 RepID=UPI00224E6988|nr:CoA transferase [Dyella humicola]